MSPRRAPGTNDGFKGAAPAENAGLEMPALESRGRLTTSEIPVRVTGESTQDGQKIYHVVYTGHNADIAEALGLTKLDAGVNAVAVRAEDLTDVQTVQLIAPSRPGA